MIGLDFNAGVASRGVSAQFVGGFESLLDFQTKMTEAMLRGYVSQLRLMHSLMMGPSMAWLNAGTLRPQLPPAPPPAPAAIAAPEPVAVAVATATNVMGPEVLPARRKARKAKAEKRANLSA